MRSVVVIEIDGALDVVASLFGDPRNSTLWMDDLERYEPLTGEPGAPGSTYRLISTNGMSFLATVVSREFPGHLRLLLESDEADVSVDAELSRLPSGATRLVSTEEFLFKGVASKAMGLLAMSAIKSAHRRHLESFKRFAEAKARMA